MSIFNGGGNTEMPEIKLAIDAQAELLSQKLEAISVAILNSSSPSGGLQFTKLTLNPTFENYATNGWQTAPDNLQAIFDGDLSTSTNTFRANSTQYSDSFLKINSGITIPSCTKIKVKMAVSNLNNNKSYFELSVGSGLGEKQPFYGEFKYRPTLETIIEIERIIPFSWEWLQIYQCEMVSWPPATKIYSIEVFKVE